MAGLDFATTRTYLSDFRFSALFIEVLGWSRPAGIRSLALNGEGRLCIQTDEEEKPQEPIIICSLGLWNMPGEPDA